MFWNWLTRFGDSTWLLPLATLGAFGMADASRRWAASVAWLLPLGIATLLVLASKVAFLGFGLGIAALDFTGASGHAMAAFAIYPVLGYVLTRAPARRARVVLSIGVAIVLASAIAISRLAIGVHSPSECVVGALCGALASGVSIAWLRSLPQAMLAPRWWWLVIGVAALATSTGGVARGGAALAHAHHRQPPRASALRARGGVRTRRSRQSRDRFRIAMTAISAAPMPAAIRMAFTGSFCT